MNTFINVSNTNFESNNNNAVAFNRRELNLILRVYGRMVALGEWRDYGISMLKDVSIFSIYRHCLLYTSPSPRDQRGSRMPSSA